MNNNDRQEKIKALNDKQNLYTDRMVEAGESYGRCNDSLDRHQATLTQQLQPYMRDQTDKAMERKYVVSVENNSMADQNYRPDFPSNLKQTGYLTKYYEDRRACTDFVKDVLDNSNIARPAQQDPAQQEYNYLLRAQSYLKDAFTRRTEECKEVIVECMTDAIENPINNNNSQNSGNSNANTGGNNSSINNSANNNGRPSSLLDDYANTSTEMPSYMDPED